MRSGRSRTGNERQDRGNRAAGWLIGRASEVDGDTIEICGERIGFNGIDAPESWQTCEDKAGREYRCGKAVAEALDASLAIADRQHLRYHEPADRD